MSNNMSASLTASLLPFFLRDLDSLRRELEAFEKDEQIWMLPEGLPNSAGTLVLHLAGNLQHYIGHHLGNTNYVRDREAEFALRNVSRQKLLDQIATTEQVIQHVLPAVNDEDLDTLFAEPIRDGMYISIKDLLLQLAVHLSYHLGQVSYHRRLVTGNATGVGALSITTLLSATKK